MSLTLKLSSLVIRTLSKPIANQIKAQAREHERFRRLCVSMAQALHRFDMRLRVGVLRDNAAAQRRAVAEAEARRHKSVTPTVKTEAETKAEEAAIAKAKAAAEEKPAPPPHIRPLSESKAIDSGANFISETFLFIVAGGLIVFESWRSRRKESTRRENVEDRLAELEQSEKAARKALVLLEKELMQLKVKHGEVPKSAHSILPRDIWEVEEKEEAEEKEGWLSYLTTYVTSWFNTEDKSEISSVNESESTSEPKLSSNKSPSQTNQPASKDAPASNSA